MVRRVAREAVEKSSMFLKEKVCTFSKRPRRRPAAKPTPALAEWRALPKPATIASSAKRIISAPTPRMKGMLPVWMPRPTMSDMSVGWTTSQTTSSSMNATAIMTDFL